MISSSDRPLAGIGFFIAGALFLSVMDGVAKWLLSGDISVIQIVTYRGIIGFTAFLIALPFCGGLNAIKTTRLKWHAVRAVFGCVAVVAFFEGLRHLSMAQSVTLFFGSAFMMTAISAIFLGERVGLHRWSAIVIGFIGVVIVTRPGDAFQLASLLPITASIGYAIFAVMGRWLGKTEGTFTMVFYYNAGLTILMASALPFVWAPVGFDVFKGIGVIAALALLGQLTLNHSYRLAPISVVAPYEYTALVWAVIIDYFIFDTMPTLMTMVGASIIVASGIYIVFRESRVREDVLVVENI